MTRFVYEGEDIRPATIAELQVLESLQDIDANKSTSELRRQVLTMLVKEGLVYHERARPDYGHGESFRLTHPGGFERLRNLQDRFRKLTLHLHFDPISIEFDRKLRESETISIGQPPIEPDVSIAGGIVVSADRRRQWTKHLPHVAISTMANGPWLITNTAWRGWVRVRTQGRRVYVSEGSC